MNYVLSHPETVALLQGLHRMYIPIFFVLLLWKKHFQSSEAVLLTDKRLIKGKLVRFHVTVTTCLTQDVLYI